MENIEECVLKIPDSVDVTKLFADEAFPVASVAPAVGSTPCMICEQDIILDAVDAFYYCGPRVCNECKKIIQFVKEKYKGEYEAWKKNLN
jgi:hypothetical protein